MLNRDGICQCSYYQPGFGTFVSSTWLARNPSRPRSWYLEAKDAAVGTAYAQHVLASYRFLMRYYAPGDELYIFGFSRGAFVARLLAEMLDHVGLLEAGNEELARYAWMTFAKWKIEGTKRDAKSRNIEEKFNYLKAFRETFCRPLSQIRYLGLFDIVNSVPKIEMRRSKLQYPFTTRTSARVIRHAVSIDERRARFRNELISDIHPRAQQRRARWHEQIQRRYGHHTHGSEEQGPQRYGNEGSPQVGGTPGALYRACQTSTGHGIGVSGGPNENDNNSPSDTKLEDAPQDIEEVWFPGTHMDIGGGMRLAKDEGWLLSHVPLVWMVQEAQRAGLKFDPEKLKQFNCFDPMTAQAGHNPEHCASQPGEPEQAVGQVEAQRFHFEEALRIATTKGQIHDTLRYDHGVKTPNVFIWRLAQYIPFRRMQLQQDGAWRPVRVPLPRGETRPIPEDASIHTSAIRRMKADPKYRPSNLIEGVNGKPKRIPREQGIGEWVVCRWAGSAVRETFRRKVTPEEETSDV